MNDLTGTMNENFDMQQLMNITGQIGMNVNNISKQVGIVTTAVANIRTDVNQLTDRMDQLELKEEVTTEQAATINRTIHRRVYEILGDNKDDLAKYTKIFSQRLYTDARRNAGLGNTYHATKKENFQRVLDYAESWTPSGGILKLKERADRMAEARRKAKEQGYDK
jgi:hypothetical protein